jgi:hypothetical protein
VRERQTGPELRVLAGEYDVGAPLCSFARQQLLVIANLMVEAAAFA